MTWLTFAFIAVAVAAWLLRGNREGVVMTKRGDEHYIPRPNEEGVRCHAWFGWYHAYVGLGDVMLIAFGVALVVVPLGWWVLEWAARFWMHHPALLLLALTIGWACYELAYPFARFGALVNPYPEHVNFFEIVRFRVRGAIMLAVRVAFVLVFLVMWRVTNGKERREG